MSARNAKVILQPAARRDVRSILLSTREQWGTLERDAYQRSLERVSATLSANPRIGRPRDEIAVGLRSFRAQQHVMYYRITADSVIVLRVLHEKMDAAQHIEAR